jgi:lycopene cyclase domain-containing protein
MKYGLLLALEVIIALIVLFLARRKIVLKAWVLTLFGLTILTIIFDWWITYRPIVQYNMGAILGVKLLTIPIEDFGYTLLAATIVPAIFELLYEYFQPTKENTSDTTD